MSNAKQWDDEWEAEERLGSASDASWSPARLDGNRAFTSLALGFLAMAPMFIAYEYGLKSDADLVRNQSEQALFRILSLAPEFEVLLRRSILGVAMIGALVLCFRRRVALGPSLFRIFIEGTIAAVALGPALAYGMRLFGGFERKVAHVAADTSLPIAARVFGAAAFEELLFRVALYGILFMLARRVALFFGVRERLSSWIADGIAVVASALGFAAIHLSAWSAWISPVGEDFDAAIFTWRALAGVLLALLFRWRGPGVAAWSHGLFNLALLIGAGPEILL